MLSANNFLFDLLNTYASNIIRVRMAKYNPDNLKNRWKWKDYLRTFCTSTVGGVHVQYTNLYTHQTFTLNSLYYYLCCYIKFRWHSTLLRSKTLCVIFTASFDQYYIGLFEPSAWQWTTILSKLKSTNESIKFPSGR